MTPLGYQIRTFSNFWKSYAICPGKSWQNKHLTTTWPLLILIYLVATLKGGVLNAAKICPINSSQPFILYGQYHPNTVTRPWSTLNCNIFRKLIYCPYPCYLKLKTQRPKSNVDPHSGPAILCISAKCISPKCMVSKWNALIRNYKHNRKPLWLQWSEPAFGLWNQVLVHS